VSHDIKQYCILRIITRTESWMTLDTVQLDRLLSMPQARVILHI